MHDIRSIRDTPDAFDAALSRRGLAPVAATILDLDEARRKLILAAETAQAEANKASKDVGAAKARGDDAEFDRLMKMVHEETDPARPAPRHLCVQPLQAVLYRSTLSPHLSVNQA